MSGIIADLLRNKRSIPYARAWRSDLNMLTITQLMVRLWVAEESRLGVSRPNGVLQNLWEPLQSHEREHRRRGLEITPGRNARSRPSSRGQGMIGPNARKTNDSDSIAAEGHSSRVTCNSSSADVCSLDDTAGNNPAGAGAAFPDPIASGTGGMMGPASGDGISGDVHNPAVNEATEIQSYAVALALKAGKRAVAMGQGGDGGGGGGRRKRASQMGSEESVAKAMTNLDMRGKIAAVLGMVGFNGSTTDGLGPSDLKASYMATSYMDFRAGEAWQRVRGLLCNPCAHSSALLRGS